jgi:hypothetical protein
VEGGVYSVKMLRALLEVEVLSVDRLVNEMNFLRPAAQAIKKADFFPISEHISEDNETTIRLYVLEVLLRVRSVECRSIGE